MEIIFLWNSTRTAIIKSDKSTPNYYITRSKTHTHVSIIWVLNLERHSLVAILSVIVLVTIIS